MGESSFFRRISEQPVSRRTLLAGSLGAAAAAGLAACSSAGGSSSAGSNIKFWDMVWGTGNTYTAKAKSIAGSYTPTGKNRGITYQSVPWANWYQTFTSAAASKTTPAVSTGAAFLPFAFLESGAVAPADDLVSKLDKAGKNDFLPGLLDAMKTSKGYAAVPWSLDLRVLWYRESILEKAGADVPTDWDSFIAAGTKLKKIGVTGLGMAGSSTTTDAQHTVAALLINNGGGLFAEDESVDCVTERNIETLDFLNECVKKGIIYAGAAAYTSTNLATSWTNGSVGMGFNQTGLDKTFPKAQQTDVKVASPLTGPHGDKGTVYYINPLMMFTTTPSQSSSEAFVEWYLDHIHEFWQAGVETDLPVKKSITDLAVIKGDPNLVKSVNEWQPLGKTIGAKAPAAFASLNTVDGGSASATFVQQIIQGQQSSKQILETLQTSLEAAIKKG
ncbi:ABC transporter substrate-binding protein [Frondihabitans australicus]|uniref:Carbohydrate ABC transporter substrate-binding protein (CUT1 family) n=1 Tax=Frondihabitans australicus TaxID=386892 RepID=A0A495IEJ3_9MICO|nr:extracellular solute-binding protein [Frondihabitans australicus]RKR74402.1 carbohydrate ABC transporter substrate-binding protein (CUT1 family) [Frondihabitans australicus]